jgi:hypothetical protein
MVAAGIAEPDAAAQAQGHANSLAAGWEEDRVKVLMAVEKTAFFQTVRSGLMTGLCSQREVWPLFLYPGESFSQGGYIERGFNDIDWR